MACFSDLHGNLVGLQSVLEAIDKFGGVDQLVCTGDMLGGGGGHEDLLDLLLENNVVMVKGNHEQGDVDITKVMHRIPELWKDWVLQTNKWLHDNISDSYWDIIAGLPVVHFAEAGGSHRLLACHAAPDDVTASVCGRQAPFEALQAAFEKTNAEIIAHGHWHQQCVQWIDKKLLVNVASVGLRFDGRSAFTIIEFIDGRWVVSQFETAYDRNEEMHLIHDRGVPEPLYDVIAQTRENHMLPL